MSIPPKTLQAIHLASVHAMAQRVADRILRAKKWSKLPQGWTEESFKSFWKTMSEGSKHPVSTCIEKMKDKMDAPGAFCASAQDHAKGGDTSWRGGKKASQVSLARVRGIAQATVDKVISQGTEDKGGRFPMSKGYGLVVEHNSGSTVLMLGPSNFGPPLVKVRVGDQVWSAYWSAKTGRLGKFQVKEEPYNYIHHENLKGYKSIRLAKVDPERAAKLLMRNFRTMVNVAMKKGGDGGVNDLGAIGDAINWIKSIKSPDKAEEYMGRAKESLSGIKSSAAFLKATQDLITASKRVPAKRHPTVGQTAIQNAFYDFSDAFVTLGMAKNRAQRAIADPEHNDDKLKKSFATAQTRVESFVARHLTAPGVASGKPKAPPPKAKAKSAPKVSNPEPMGEVLDEDTTEDLDADTFEDVEDILEAPTAELENLSSEPETDSYGLSGRYKNRTVDPKDKKKKKAHAMVLSILKAYRG